MSPEQYLDALLTLPGLYGAQVSKDGKWVAWTWFRAAPTAEVFIAPTDGSKPPTRLTDTPENTYLVSWTPDSSAVLVVQDHDGDERPQIFRVNLNQPLNMLPLTQATPNYFMYGGDLHPNGKWLIYAANVDASTGQEIEPMWVYRQDIETGERLPLAKPQKGGFVVPSLSPTGEHVVYGRADLHPAGYQMWLVGIDGSHDHEILNAGSDKKAFASWFPDGKRLVVTVETDTHKKVGVFDLKTEQIRWLVDDPLRNIEDAYVPYDSEQIVLLEVKNAVMQTSCLHPETGEETPLPFSAGNLYLVAPVSENEWIAQYYSSTQPADVVRVRLDDLITEHFKSLSRVWEQTSLTQADLTPAESFEWQSVDGLTIQGWLYRPQGKAKGTVVYVHGGPTAHSQDSINNQIQYYVRQGYNVLDPNYRGSTGFSLEFREAIKKQGWGSLEQDDIRTGIEALIDAGIAERGKVGMTGTSYGGYSSWCGITRFSPDLLAASAPICGMTDLVVDYYTTRPDLRPYSEEMLGGKPDEVPERYQERSPINFVENIKGELLIVQGMQDPNVTPENVSTVVKALQGAGIEHSILAFEDEGHGISKPKNQKTLYQELVNFFEQAFNKES